MEDAELEVPPEQPETAPEELLEGSPAERASEAGLHADREARKVEAAEGPPSNAT